MKNKSSSNAGIFRPRFFLAFNLFASAALLAAAAFSGMSDPSAGHARGANSENTGEGPERYMPVPGGAPDDLDRLEMEWNNRLTYPTGRFDPAWVRAAAAKDGAIARGIPAGKFRRSCRRLGALPRAG